MTMDLKLAKPSLLLFAFTIFAICNTLTTCAQENVTEQQLERLLKRFPKADLNGDGKLTKDEAIAFRDRMLGQQKGKWKSKQGGVKRSFDVDPGWKEDRFPEDAVCYKTPEEIRAIFEKTKPANQRTVVSYPKPADGAIRVVGVGHSFMTPGYKTLPLISRGAGMSQPLYTHVGGGMTGSARYKWEQENGIFGFEGKPEPKLLCSIANAKWDAMMFGPYFHDRPAYYSCWFDFCLKHNPEMKFYLSDAWPQLAHLKEKPTSEEFFTEEIFDQMAETNRSEGTKMLGSLLDSYPNKVLVVPTSDAMVLAAKHFLRGELPGIDGLHRVIGKKERSLWKDQLGHLGPGFERLEGYVFYATLYGRSPELIENEIRFQGNPKFPSPELDRVFRKIAWQAVSNHPNSVVTDKDGDGINDSKPSGVVTENKK